MLTADDSGSDGGRLRYLQEPAKWADLDPDLYGSLRELITPSSIRTVAAIERCRSLQGFRFYSNMVPPGRRERATYLTTLLENAWGKAELIFFDPDNGVTDIRFGRNPSEKHLYWHEVATAFAWGFSVVFYQHFPRQSRDQFIEERAHLAARRTGATEVYSFQTPDVVFFLIVQERHREKLRSVSDRAAGWGGQIKVRSFPVGRRDE